MAISWKCKKQIETALHSNGAEIRALQTGVKETISLRHLLTNLGLSIPKPTVTYEDNQATIRQVLANRLTPQVRHLDVLITWLNEQHLKGIFTPHYTKTTHMLADFNTKPTGGKHLHTQHQLIIGANDYPPSDTKHYYALDLHKYSTNNYRTSQ